MGKIVSRKLAKEDDWIFSKSIHVFKVKRYGEFKNKEKQKPNEKKKSRQPCQG